MAITSELGWTPAGTPHHSIWNFASSPATNLPSVAEWEDMTALTALVILYVSLTNDSLSFDPIQTLPTESTPESAVTPHYGSGMWIGPGVRFYVC